MIWGVYLLLNATTCGEKGLTHVFEPEICELLGGKKIITGKSL